MNHFYVYSYCDGRKPGKFFYGSLYFDYEPFYVGKGQFDRAMVHMWNSSNKDNISYMANKIRKIIRENSSVRIVKVMENLSNAEALSFEKYCIGIIGRKGIGTGPLVNLTAGGEGTSDLDPIMLSERNRKISESNKGVRTGRTLSEEWKKNQSNGQIRRYANRHDSFLSDLPALNIDVFTEMLNTKVRLIGVKYDTSEYRVRKSKILSDNPGVHTVDGLAGWVPKGELNPMFGVDRSGTKSPTAKFYYVIIDTNTNNQYFVDKGCLNSVCDKLKLGSTIFAAARYYEKHGKLFVGEKGTNRGWTAVRFTNLDDNPFIQAMDNRAAKPHYGDDSCKQSDGEGSETSLLQVSSLEAVTTLNTYEDVCSTWTGE